ncbi:MAG TPA: glutathione S-transferase family protein [Solirubrobacterales bacterium]|nr:glutathione S-transferase family protein [Solirubrobacterales bacterium]
MTKPVLWHIPVSHFSEKARWALAWKGVEHERRAPLPGAHIPIALWLTRGAQKTFPVLRLDGRNIGDSTAIIAALEQRWPDPPLYPEDPQARAHALELEDFFDERLGPQIRLLAWHELRTDREQMATLSRTMLPEPMRDFGPAVAAGGAFGSAYVQLRFRVASDEAAALAGDQVLGAFERLESELDRGDGEFLVGDAFSVADLTAASLFYPIVNPPEGPSVFGDAPPWLEEFFAPLRERPGGQWIAETFRRYREPETSTTASISTGTSNGS